MKNCPKCEKWYELEEYGTQTYCRTCWREYDARKRREKTTRRKGDTGRRQLEDSIAYMLEQYGQDAADKLRAKLEAEGRL
jgi:uncharacterized Zn ribbon protein